MANTLPVVYLAFANALDDHLANLKLESRDIFKSLQPLQKEGKIWVHREESSQVDELYDDLLGYDQDIVIFHYGGHASGDILQLEGGHGAAGGIAKLLGQQKSLKLVFLNGCATKDQVNLLHQAGVPAVIATSVKINDSKATIFATAFYQSLTRGHSIEEAFESASSLLETKFSGDDVFDISFSRFPKWGDVEEDEVEQDTQGLEWALYIREDASKDIAHWRLNTAQSEWHVQLRDRHGPLRSVIDDKPFTILHKSVQRTLSANLCANCGSTLLGNGLDSKSCTVCQNKNIDSGNVSTALPDQIVDHTFSNAQARRIAQKVFEAEHTNGKASRDLIINSITPIWVPHWKFGAKLYSEFEGEGAFAAGLDGDAPKLEWRSTKDRFDTDLTDHLIVAAKAPRTQSESDIWDLSSARNFEPEDSSNLSMLLDTDIEEAFDKAAANLDQYLESEISGRIGGLEQRNLQTDTKYDQVAAKLIWLPFWSATGAHNQENLSLIINGQNGAILTPRTADNSGFQNQKNTFMNKKILTENGESHQATLITSVFSGVGIGIMVGLLMGLAAPQGADAKSIVSIFIGAVGVALAALLGLNDRHFSVAKGLRIGSFGLAVTIAALSGIYIRDHGLLSPSTEDRFDMVSRIIPNLSDREKMRMLGLSPEKPIPVIRSVANLEYDSNLKISEPESFVVKRIPDGIPVQPTDQLPNTSPAKILGNLGGSFLFSQEVNLDVCSELQNAYEQELPPSDIINNFKQVDGFAWGNFATKVDALVNEDNQKQTLFAGRDVICGFEEFTSPAIISATDCEILNVAKVKQQFEIFQTSFNKVNLDSVVQRVNTKISEPQRVNSMSTLVSLFCTRSGN
jgi:hypothetical protein